MRIESERHSPSSGLQAADQQMVAEWAGLKVGRKMEIIGKVKNFAGDYVPAKRTGEVEGSLVQWAQQLTLGTVESCTLGC